MKQKTKEARTLTQATGMAVTRVTTHEELVVAPMSDCRGGLAGVERVIEGRRGYHSCEDGGEGEEAVHFYGGMENKME